MCLMIGFKAGIFGNKQSKTVVKSPYVQNLDIVYLMYVGNRYSIGDEIVLKRDCVFEIMGRIKSLSNDGFELSISERRTKGGVSKVIPVESYIIRDGTFIDAVNTCLDVNYRGVSFKIEQKVDSMNKKYILAIPSVEGRSTLPH